jgi:hypothetical protein
MWLVVLPDVMSSESCKHLYIFTQENPLSFTVIFTWCVFQVTLKCLGSNDGITAGKCLN